jgi:hypothetical protein
VRARLCQQRIGFSLKGLHRVGAGSEAKRRSVERRQLHEGVSELGGVPSCPVMPAVEEMVITRPDRCRRITGSTARVTFIGPKSSVSI